MCGHVFHESWVEEDGYKRVWKIWNPRIKEVIKLQKQFVEKSQDIQQFYTELKHEENTIKTIAYYYGTGMFNEIDE